MNKKLKNILLIITIFIPFIFFFLYQYEANFGKYSYHIKRGTTFSDIHGLEKVAVNQIEQIGSTIESLDKSEKTFEILKKDKYDKLHSKIHTGIESHNELSSFWLYKNHMPTESVPAINTYESAFYPRINKILNYEEYKQFSKNIFMEPIYTDNNLLYLMLFPPIYEIRINEESYPRKGHIVDYNLIDISYDENKNEITVYMEYILDKVPELFFPSKPFDFAIIPIANNSKLNKETKINIIEISTLNKTER